MTNLTKNLLRFPPKLVYLLARKGGKPMGMKLIADESGLPLFTVASVFEHPTWDEIPVARVAKITTACGVDFSDRACMNRIETYLAKNNHRPSFKYLTKHEAWQTHYLPFLLEWKSGMASVPKTLPVAIQKLLAKLPLKQSTP